MGHTSGARSLPGIFEPTIFSPPRDFMTRSTYIKAMHPKTEISSKPESLKKILAAGWVGQIKIHGHRAQIHLYEDESEETLTYNRQGRLHKKLLPDEIVLELRRLLNLKNGWTVLDCEWLKPENKLFIFDILKMNDENLRRLTYDERWHLLPKDYISPYVQTLPLLKTLDKCEAVLKSREEYIEGLVFKSLSTKGFEDTAIVRCRKRL